jgi:colicin import membrane protein
MKIPLVFCALVACLLAHAQTINDAERMRISNERAALESGFSREDTACYKRFLVNRCLDEVKVRRSDAMADLRRQEILINDQERKARGAEQVQKTEDKASLEKQQQDADRRAEALKDYEDRLARDRQKNADRIKAQSNEKASVDAATARAKGAQDKEAGRTAKQSTAAEEVKKYNERLEKAKDRQVRMARDKASQTKAPAAPLPAP